MDETLDRRRRSAATVVAVGRLGYGSLMTLAPRKMLRLQTGTDAEGFSVWMGRAFGVRDALLGAGALLAADDSAKRGWVSAGIAADACDCVSAVFGGRWLGRRNAVIIGITAATATAAQVWSISARR